MLITIPFQSGSFEPLVKVDQRVDFQTPLFKKKLEEEVVVPLASKIKIAPKNIYLHLKKVIGDPVQKGELIAMKKSFFTEVEYHSEYDGVIKEIDHQEGYILIGTTSGTVHTISSYFKGTVEAVNDHEIKVRLGPGHEYPLSQASSNFGGEAIFFEESQINSINEKTVGLKVVITKKLASYEESKLEALGIDGFVTIDELEGTPSLPYARLQNAEDLEKISKLKLPYCIIDKAKSIIYFYH